MDIWQAAALGLLQGITEFAPVSSTGHLVLFEHFFGLRAPELASFDIVLHAGTLLALVIIFWDKLWGILRGDWGLFAQLVVATIPAAIIGVLFGDWMDAHWRTVSATAICFIFSGLLFLALHWWPRSAKKLGWFEIIMMSMAQAFALVPAISRSGMTVAMARILKISEAQAAEFSFLMLIPAVCGAIVLFLAKGDLVPSEMISAPYLVGFVISAMVSYLVARGMLHFFRRFGLTIFGFYLLLLGILLALPVFNL